MITADPTLMLTEFREQICREPWNDHIRGQFADWAEEQGEPYSVLAECVRGQMELVKLPVHHSRGGQITGGPPCRHIAPEKCNECRDLQNRIAALLAAHASEWYKPLVEALPKCGECEGSGSWITDPRLVCPVCQVPGSGLAVVWRPGKVLWDAEVECTLAQFVGERCGRCDGTTRLYDGPQLQADGDCPDCHDGYVGGLAAVLPTKANVSWVLGDRRPQRTGEAFWWNKVGENLDNDGYLPAVLFDRLEGFTHRWTGQQTEHDGKMYPTAPAAQAALADVLFRTGREWCGLPTWPEENRE